MTLGFLTSVQSVSRGTAVSVGLMVIVFNSIRLFRELPPTHESHTRNKS